MGFPRQEYWNGLPFPSPEDLPNLGIEPVSPALQADSLLLSHLWSPDLKVLLCFLKVLGCVVTYWFSEMPFKRPIWKRMKHWIASFQIKKNKKILAYELGEKKFLFLSLNSVLNFYHRYSYVLWLKVNVCLFHKLFWQISNVLFHINSEKELCACVEGGAGGGCYLFPVAPASKDHEILKLF